MIESRWMRSGWLLLLCLSILIPVAIAEAQVSPPQYFGGTGHWYQIVPIASPPLCWDVCRDSAVKLGGYLATIGSQPENDFIMSLDLPGANVASIGGSDPARTGEWKWVDGDQFFTGYSPTGTCVPSHFCNWGSGEPNDGGVTGMYLQIWTNHYVTVSKRGKWNDSGPCDGNSLSFIVEYDTDTEPCKFGNALRFDGVDDYVYVAHSPSQNPTNLTIEAYIKMDSIPTSVQSSAQAIVSKWRGVSSAIGSYMLGIASMADSGKVILNVEPSLALFSRQRLNPHQWYHVAATWDGSTAKIYIDGVLDTAVSMAGQFLSNREITIGRNSHSLWDGGVAPVTFNGVIDEVRISSIARTPAEFCMSSECPTDANTVALWHFNETSGGTAYDATSNHFDGTIYGATHEVCGGSPSPFYFVHITDPHVTSNNNSRWCADIAALRALSPTPDFVVCSGDLVEWGAFPTGDTNYIALLSCLYSAGEHHYIDPAHTIPIYFCPGNHDARYGGYIWGGLPGGLLPVNFDNYHARIDDDDFVSVRHKNVALLSVNSGMDVLWPWLGNWLDPEGDGLDNKYSNEVTKLADSLDALDGINNDMDNSDYVKVVITHHPYQRAGDDGVFLNGRSDFLAGCNNYNVNYLLCGHLHYDDLIDTVTGSSTEQVITESIKDRNAYRIIRVNGSSVTVEADSFFSPTIGGSVACEAVVNIYDQYGNHDGPDSTGAIEVEIPYSTYSFWRYDTLGIHETLTEYSLPYEDSVDYTITISSLSNDSLNIAAYTQMVSGASVETTYTNIPVDSGSVLTMTADSSRYNYILSVDDNGDGHEDRVVLPDGGYSCGDANGDGTVNISDAVYLIAYIFSGGLAPNPLLSGDANCDSTVNISDAVYLIAYIFAGGAAPCAGCK